MASTFPSRKWINISDRDSNWSCIEMLLYIKCVSDYCCHAVTETRGGGESGNTARSKTPREIRIYTYIHIYIYTLVCVVKHDIVIKWYTQSRIEIRKLDNITSYILNISNNMGKYLFSYLLYGFKHIFFTSFSD